MITFWVDEPNSFTIRNYLSGRGEAIRERFRVQPYQWPAGALAVGRGTHVFAALDQLSLPEHEAVALLQRQLAAAGDRVLNRAERCLLRPALLERLANEGLNSFRAYSAREAQRVTRFPVFVRGAYDHGGSLTARLRAPLELRRALLALRLRGYRLDDLLIVEFCDTSDRHGLFRKYAAHKVGETVVPAHLMAGTHWMLKSEQSVRTEELAAEDLAFVEHNPHEDWLRRVFDLAGVEFGRIDYGVLDGLPQAWEINLNPTIGRHPAKLPRDMEPAVAEVWRRTRELAHGRLREAFAAVDRPAAGEPVPFTLEPALRVRIERAGRRRRRRRNALRLLGRAYHSPLGAPFRFLLPRIDPSAE